MLRRGHAATSPGLLHGLDLGDPDGHVAAAWIAAQDLRLLYRHTDPDRAAQAFTRWLEFCADSNVPELHPWRRSRGWDAAGTLVHGDVIMSSRLWGPP